MAGTAFRANRMWGRATVFVVEVFLVAILAASGGYTDPVGFGLVVSALLVLLVLPVLPVLLVLLVLPGILPGFAPRHGR